MTKGELGLKVQHEPGDCSHWNMTRNLQQREHEGQLAVAALSPKDARLYVYNVTAIKPIFYSRQIL